jgi:hypothetical protein
MAILCLNEHNYGYARELIEQVLARVKEYDLNSKAGRVECPDCGARFSFSDIATGEDSESVAELLFTDSPEM